MTAARPGTGVAVCMKWVDRRPAVDPLSGEVTTDPRSSGPSDADRAALEWGLRLGAEWGWPVTVATVGSPATEPMLKEALATGARRAVRVDADPERPSEQVARLLATVVRGAGLVLCGDWSLDRGSGSVPAFLAAELGARQGLGLVAITSDAPGELRAERRLDGGRREILRLAAPAVASVEGSTAELRRAPLEGVIAARDAVVEVVPAGPAHPGGALPPQTVPYRPRPRVLPAPDPALPARRRVEALLGAGTTPKAPPKTVVLSPAEAVEEILARLREWR